MTPIETTTAKADKPETYEFISEDQAEKFSEMLDKKFIRIDPATGKPHEASKEFFWQVISIIDDVTRSGGDENKKRFVYAVGKFYRDKTYKVSASPNSSSTAMVTKHQGYCRHNSRGEMIESGVDHYDCERFLKQFKEDNTI